MQTVAGRQTDSNPQTRDTAPDIRDATTYLFTSRKHFALFTHTYRVVYSFHTAVGVDKLIVRVYNSHPKTAVVLTTTLLIDTSYWSLWSWASMRELFCPDSNAPGIETARPFPLGDGISFDLFTNMSPTCSFNLSVRNCGRDSQHRRQTCWFFSGALLSHLSRVTC